MMSVNIVGDGYDRLTLPRHRLYSSTIAVITHYTRPSGLEEEFEARRLLTQTLATFDRLSTLRAKE